MRDKIDAGEFDDRSNLGSMLNTQMDADENPIDLKQTNTKESGGILGRFIGKRPKVTRTE